MSLAIDFGIGRAGIFKIGDANLEFRSQPETLPVGKDFFAAASIQMEVRS